MTKNNRNFSSEDMYAAAYDIRKSKVKYAEVYSNMLYQAAFVQETFNMRPVHFWHIAKDAKEEAEHLANYFGKGFSNNKPMNYKPIHNRKERK